MRVLSLSLSLSCSFLRYERFFSWWIRVRVCHVTKRIHSSVPYRIPYVKWRWEKKEQAGITVRGNKERKRPRSKRRRRIAGRNVAVKQFVECPVISGEQQSGLLRNSDGGKAWGFLLQLIAARLRPSVRSFILPLLTSSLLLPTLHLIGVLTRHTSSINDHIIVKAAFFFFLLHYCNTDLYYSV